MFEISEETRVFNLRYIYRHAVFGKHYLPMKGSHDAEGLAGKQHHLLEHCQSLFKTTDSIVGIIMYSFARTSPKMLDVGVKNCSELMAT